jgi:hypothetical protein
MTRCKTCGTITGCECSQRQPIWRHRPCKYCNGAHLDATCTTGATRRIVQPDEGRHVLLIEKDGDVKMSDWTACQFCLEKF